jgi:hypothetical protein
MSRDLEREIGDAVSEFVREANVDGLKIKGPFDLRKLDEKNDPYYWRHHNANFEGRYSLQAGVYVIASSTIDGFYVGSSIGGGSAIGNRLWGHHFGSRRKFKKDREQLGPEEAVRAMLDKKANPTSGRFVDTRFMFLILVPDEKRWLASALESFLIEKLDPPWNDKGRKRGQ